MILLSDEQRLLKETLERFLTEQYGFPTRQKVSESASGFSQELWQGAVDLGLLAACLPEEVGGLGGSAVELAIIQEAFGTHLVRSPLSGTLSAGLTLTRLNRHELLPQLAAGEIKLALAHDEPGDAFGADLLLCEAKRAGNGFELIGHKSAVPFGAACDHWLVSAQLDGAPALFLVPAKAASVTIDDYPTHDGGRASDLRFDGVKLSADALLGGAEAVQLAVAIASAALLPEASGACWAVQNQTLDYFKTRKQFGQTLGSFQALQHRIVDVYIECQLAQSMAWDAISALDPKVPAAERAKRIAQAKAFVGRAGRQVGKEGVQLHGGIGMTWDLPIGHYLKRLMAIDSVLGPSDRQLKRLAEGERKQ